MTSPRRIAANASLPLLLALLATLGPAPPAWAGTGAEGTGSEAAVVEAAALDCRAVLASLPETADRAALEGRVYGPEPLELLAEFAAGAASHPQLAEIIDPEFLVYVLDPESGFAPAPLAAELRLVMARASATGETVAAAFLAEAPSTYRALLRFQLEITRLKGAHKHAVHLASTAHAHQKYGEKSYRYHLSKVRDVLKRFGHGPKDSLQGLALGTAALLHDIFEDTTVPYELVRELFGARVAEAARRVTNEPERDGLSKEDRKRITLERIAGSEDAILLKLADRIANTEESKCNLLRGEHNKFAKYQGEWADFARVLRPRGGDPAMWEHLERLLTEPDYLPSSC